MFCSQTTLNPRPPPPIPPSPHLLLLHPSIAFVTQHASSPATLPHRSPGVRPALYGGASPASPSPPPHPPRTAPPQHRSPRGRSAARLPGHSRSRPHPEPPPPPPAGPCPSGGPARSSPRPPRTS